MIHKRVVDGKEVHTDGQFEYDITTLLDLVAKESLPTHPIKLEEISSALSDNAWEEPRQKDPISPMTVIANPGFFPYHAKKIDDADLSRPILLRLRPYWGYEVVNGLHRLAKASRKGRKTIESQLVPSDLMDKVKTPMKKEEPAHVF